MIDWLINLLGGTIVAQVVSYGVGSLVLMVLLWFLKKTPNHKIRAVFGRFMYGLGVALTLGASVWLRKLSPEVGGKIWQAVEDWILDLVENVGAFGLAEFVRGARSDNLKSIKDQTSLNTKL